MQPLFSPDRPVFVVGGGPSLRALNWAALDGEQAVAVNLAYRKLPNAPALFFGDTDFYRRHRDADPASDFWRFKGARVFSTAPLFADGKHPRIAHVAPAGLVLTGGFSAKDCNSGVQAAVLARLLGAGEVWLLGFDNEPGHWAEAERYAHPSAPDPRAYRTYRAQLDALLAADPAVRRADAASHPHLFV